MRPAPRKWTRRAFLVGGLGLAALPAAGLAARAGPAAPPVSLDEFLNLSAALVDLPPGRLDRHCAARYLESLASWARPEDLRRLVRAAGDPPDPAAPALSAALERRPLRHLAAAILECWYTGIYETPGGLRVATFEGALAWDALGEVPPPSVCGR